MMISSFAVKNTSNMFHITTKVLCECKRGLNGKICDCKLSIHAKCVDELRKMDGVIRKVRNRRAEIISNGTIMIHLDEQEMCCHHSLKDLQVHTDGAW